MITLSSFDDLYKLDKKFIYYCKIYSKHCTEEEGLLIFDLEKYPLPLREEDKHWFLLSNQFDGIDNKTKVSAYKYSWIFTDTSDFNDFVEHIEVLFISHDYLLF